MSVGEYGSKKVRRPKYRSVKVTQQVSSFHAVPQIAGYE